MEYTPSEDNSSGTTCEDYFATAIANAVKEVDKKDDFKRYPLLPDLLAFYSFALCNLFLSQMLLYLAINFIKQ